MDGNTVSSGRQPRAALYRIAPGLGVLSTYQRDWLRHDLIAGVSVAAVALPTAIAYAQIIGLDPVIGLYAAIPALLAYAMFGTSRHLIVNPEAATCAMIGATLTPLAAGNSEALLSLSVASQCAAGLCQGFAVSGTESRTAMNHSMGGKSQVAGLVAATVMAAVLLFLTVPLSYLPKAALGAVLIFAAIGLFDLTSLRRLWRVSRSEFGIAIATMLGVIAIDVLEGIVMAVSLALLLLLKRSAPPPDAILVRVPGMKGFHDLTHHADAIARARAAALPVWRRDRVLQRLLPQKTRFGSGGCPTRPEMAGHRRQHRQRD